MAARPRILFVTTGLDTGGAEKMLAKLLSRLHGSAVEAEVVSLLGHGSVSDELVALGVPVRHLDVRRPLRGFVAPCEILRAVRRFAPNVIQGWMYHGNLTASFARACSGSKPALVWGIRQSLYSLSREKPGTRAVIRLGATLSSWASMILYNSETARQQHEEIGYRSEGARVVDNGFDVDRFVPDEQAYREVRSELAIPSDSRLVGLIARLHPMKGHSTFIRAACLLAARNPDVHFLLAGHGVEVCNPVCIRWLKEPKLVGRLHLLGERVDIPRLTAALDIACCASWSEAFPNVLGEAMSCGVPCVATDVGDARRIIGDAGLVVPADDPETFVQAWRTLLDMPREARQRLGIRARQRVQKHFSLRAICDQYMEIYSGMAR
jgi:glycosyltransferase involved in cell wall biosynthesis